MKINFFKDTSNEPYKLIKENKYKHKDKFFKKLAKEYDDYGFISKELGRELKSLFQENGYKIGLHRTGYSNFNEKTINDLFTKGLINNGDSMQGAQQKYVITTKTVDFENNFTIFMGMLKTACNYKCSSGAVIVKIPEDYIEKGINDKPTKPIYYNYNGIMRLMPEYIYGYIPLGEKGMVGNIIRNPNYKDIHDYKPDGLISDGEDISKINTAPKRK